MSDDSYNNDYFGMDDDTYAEYEQPAEQEETADYGDGEDDGYTVDRGAKVKEILEKVKEFFLNLWDKIKKMDRKNLIILICIILAVLIILISLAKGLSGRKRRAEDNPVTAPPVVEATSSRDIPSPISGYSPSSSGLGYYTVYNTDSLNLRETPNTEHDPITEIPAGRVVEVFYIEEVDGDKWARVEYNNERGWVMMDYLQEGGTPSATPQGAAG